MLVYRASAAIRNMTRTVISGDREWRRISPSYIEALALPRIPPPVGPLTKEPQGMSAGAAKGEKRGRWHDPSGKPRLRVVRGGLAAREA